MAPPGVLGAPRHEQLSLELADELREFIATKISALARPDDILFSNRKTRYGRFHITGRKASLIL